MSKNVYRGLMDMYEMMGLVLIYIYIYDGYGLRNTELIFNCKQMNIINLSVSVKSNRLQKINEIKTE
jgi:hypothetical protein